MGKSILLKNASLYNEEYNKKTKCNIQIENGIIKSIEKIEVDKDSKITNTNVNALHTEKMEADIKQIDLNGKLVLPGFIDSHLHIPGNILYDDFGVNLMNCNSKEEYIQKLKEVKSKKYKVIRAVGWNEEDFNGDPNESENFKTQIDKIFLYTPVVIYSTDFHSCFCNTKTLEICNINENTKDSFGGEIEKTKQGRLTGILREQATKMLQNSNINLGFTKEEMKSAILKYQTKLIKYGITAVNTLMFIGGDYATEWDILKEIETEGKLKIKINGSIPVNPQDNPEEVIDRYKKMQRFNSDKIRINTAKIYIDGVLDTKTAFLNEPYVGTNNCGYSLWKTEKLEKMVQVLDENEIQIHVHSIGDAATKQIVTALEKAIQKNGTLGDLSNRHTVTHLQLADDEDIEKMVKNNIIAAIQPYWFPIDENGVNIDYDTIGEQRVNSQYKLKTMLDKGVLITSSSDSPVTEDFNPLLGIYQGIKRHNEKERATKIQMIKSFTVNGAYQLKRENEIGRIKEGMSADLIILEDIIQASEEELKKISVDMCLIDGEIVQISQNL